MRAAYEAVTRIRMVLANQHDRRGFGGDMDNAVKSKIKWEKCEEMATIALWGWRVKDPLLTRRLAELILKDQKLPNIRIFWNSKQETLDFEVLK